MGARLGNSLPSAYIGNTACTDELIKLNTNINKLPNAIPRAKLAVVLFINITYMKIS
jgi:hypothetical protein